MQRAQFRSVVFLGLLTLASLCAPAQEPLPFDEINVFRSDALRITCRGKDELVSLYGVEHVANNPQISRQAKAHLKDRIAGQKVSLHTVKQVAGLRFVTVTVGETVLNEELLSLGLAKLDKLSAYDDERYKQFQDTARQESRGLWAKPVSLNEVDKAVSRRAASPLTSKEYALRRDFMELAEFEAEYIKWRVLPDSYRSSLIAHYAGLRSTELEQNDALIEQRTATAAELAAETLGHQLDLQALSEREARALQDIYDDFDLFVNQRAANSYAKTAVAKSATGQDNLARHYARQADEHAVKASMDRDRVSATASAAAQHFGAMKARQQAILQQSQRQWRRAEGLSLAAARLAHNTDRRLLTALNRLQLLETAAEENYVPALSGNRVIRFEGVTTPFEIQTDLWRVDWYIDFPDIHSSLTIDLLEADGRSPVSRFKADALPHEAFSVQWGKGLFSMNVKADPGVRWLIDVYEIATESAGVMPDSGANEPVPVIRREVRESLDEIEESPNEYPPAPAGPPARRRRN